MSRNDWIKRNLDKYANFQQLSDNEIEGVDFRVRTRECLDAKTAVIAPHGGGIEPGTSELALSVADSDLSWATFDGLKASGNADLHITSTRFDVPKCVDIITRSQYVLTIHGESSLAEVAYIGGRDELVASTIREELENRGFETGIHDSAELSGRAAENICNMGIRGVGVQLELSRGLRQTFFQSLGAQGRKQTTRAFDEFVTAIRSGLRRGGGI